MRLKPFCVLLAALTSACGRVGVDTTDAEVCVTAFCEGFGDGSVNLLDPDAETPEADGGVEPVDGAVAVDSSSLDDAGADAGSDVDSAVEPGDSGSEPLPAAGLAGTWRVSVKRLKYCDDGAIVEVDEPFETDYADPLYVHAGLNISFESGSYAVVSTEGDALVTEAVLTDLLNPARQGRSVITLRLVAPDTFEGTRELYDLSNTSGCSGGDANKIIREDELRGERLP